MSCCEHIDPSIPPLPPSVVMHGAGLLDHHHHLLDMDGTDSMCLNQCRMHGGNCPSSSDVVNPHPACVNVNHHILHHHYQHTNNNNINHINHTRNHSAAPTTHHLGQGVFSPTSSTSSSPLPVPRGRLNSKSRQLHHQLKTCCLSPGSSDTLSCGHMHEPAIVGDMHHHHHSDYADHELMPVFQSAGDMSLPTQPPPLIVDPIITSIAAVAAAAATAALTSLKSEEAESGLTNKTLTTTTTITTPKRLTGGGGSMASNTKKNVIKSMAYGAQSQGNINSVSITDNSISISQSLADDACGGQQVQMASKSSQTPKSTKKKTATATATITKQIPSHCSGGESGGLITTSATITGEADCSLMSSDVDCDGGTVSSMGSTMYGGGCGGKKMANGCVDRGVGGSMDIGDRGEDEDDDEDDDEEDIDELVNGSGENLVETAISPRSRKAKQSKPKKLKPANKTKNPRSNNNNSNTNINNNSTNQNKKNHKQLKTNFDDIAADRESQNEASGSGMNAGAKPPGLRNRWHGCPELHKAMAGVTYIADHTRKEEESTRVSKWCSIGLTTSR